MRHIPMGWRLVAAVFVVFLLPRTSSAQELRPSLKVPTTIASIAAAADWASTYHALTNYHVRETNILLQPFQKSPGKLVVVGAAIDMATFTAWNKWVGPACGPWPASPRISFFTTSATSRNRCAARPDARCRQPVCSRRCCGIRSTRVAGPFRRNDPGLTPFLVICVSEPLWPAVHVQFNDQSVSEVTSLMNTRLPEITGCVQVSTSDRS